MKGRDSEGEAACLPRRVAQVLPERRSGGTEVETVSPVLDGLGPVGEGVVGLGEGLGCEEGGDGAFGGVLEDQQGLEVCRGLEVGH